MKYVDAEKLKTEITRLKGQLIRGACASQTEMETNCKDEAYNEVLAIITSLQQEPSEVDFDREAVSFCYDNGINISPRQAKTIALHFFGLGLGVGLSARKEAAEDREATAENNALKWL